MQGLMMDVPLTVTAILRHAEQNHPEQQVVSVTADHPRHRYSYREPLPVPRNSPMSLPGFRCRPGPGWQRSPGTTSATWNCSMPSPVRGGSCIRESTAVTKQIAWIINDAGATVLFAAPSSRPAGQALPHLLQLRTIVFMTGPGTCRPPRRRRCWPTRCATRHSWRRRAPRSGGLILMAGREFLCYTSGPREIPKGSSTSSLHRAARHGGLRADVLGVRATDTVLPVVPIFT